MTPIAVVCWFGFLGHLPIRDTWAFWVLYPVTTAVFTILALGELVGDKLPMTPNRTAIFPLLARVGFGGLVGAIAATNLRGSILEGIILGAISGLAGSFLGFHVRRHLVKVKLFKDLHIALVEDAVTIGLSIVAMGIVIG
jgi:uncharacterized membrane protein